MPRPFVLFVPLLVFSSCTPNSKPAHAMRTVHPGKTRSVAVALVYDGQFFRILNTHRHYAEPHRHVRYDEDGNGVLTMLDPTITHHALTGAHPSTEIEHLVHLRVQPLIEGKHIDITVVSHEGKSVTHRIRVRAISEEVHGSVCHGHEASDSARVECESQKAFVPNRLQPFQMVFMSEGYTDRQAFYDDVREFYEFRTSAKKQLGLRWTQPWSRYELLYNVFAVFQPSAESGVTTKNLTGETTRVRSNFGCTISGAQTTSRNVTCDDAKIFAVESQAPTANVSVVLLNTNANDELVALTRGRRIYIAANDAAKAYGLAHELGHATANLSDEYTKKGTVGPGAKNCWKPTWGGEAPWQSLIDAGLVGEPVRGCAQSDHYRPTDERCLMRRPAKHGLHAPGEYCAVCEQAIVEELYAQNPRLFLSSIAIDDAAIIERARHVERRVDIGATAEIVLHPRLPLDDRVMISWQTDYPRTFDISPDRTTLSVEHLVPGQHRFRATLIDKGTTQTHPSHDSWMREDLTVELEVRCPADTTYNTSAGRCVSPSPFLGQSLCVAAQSPSCPGNFEPAGTEVTTTPFRNKSRLPNVSTGLDVERLARGDGAVVRQGYCCTVADRSRYARWSDNVCFVQYSDRCPVESMQVSSVTYDTEDHDNGDAWSQGAPYSVRDSNDPTGRVTVNYCCASRPLPTAWWDSETARAAGYCYVQSKSAAKACAPGFSEEWIQLDTADADNSDHVWGDVGARKTGLSHHGVQVNLCCSRPEN